WARACRRSRPSPWLRRQAVSNASCEARQVPEARSRAPVSSSASTPAIAPIPCSGPGRLGGEDQVAAVEELAVAERAVELVQHRVEIRVARLAAVLGHLVEDGVQLSGHRV